MVWIQSIFDGLPTHWAIMGLIGVIGLSVVFLRWMIRIAVRAFLIGLVGVILIGALYYLISYTGLTL